MLYRSQDLSGVPSHPVLTAATDALFFRACVAMWASDPDCEDFVAAVFNDRETTVIAGGRRSFSVETSTHLETVDPKQSAFVVEKTIPGSFVRLTLGTETSHPCLSYGGSLPVSGFAIAPFLSDRKGVSTAVMSDGSIPVADSPRMDPPASIVVSVVAEVPEVMAPVEVRPLVAVMAGSTAAPILAVSPLAVDSGADADETVWPTQGRATPTPTPTSTPIEAPELIEPRDMLAGASPMIDISDHAPANHEINGFDQSPQKSADSVPHAMTLPLDTSTLTSSAATLHWTAPGIAPGIAAWEDDLDGDGDLTMMKGDHGIRPTTIPMVTSVSPRVDPNEVLGAYCVAGHFTDSRKITCLFCSGEVDLGKFGPGVRPAMGRLEFDDGQVVELDRGVLIGRRPTGDDHHLISYPGDMLLSRIHTEVKFVDWDVVVIDRQSANGTSLKYPDGRVVSARPNLETVIENGTTVRLGSTLFTYRRNG